MNPITRYAKESFEELKKVTWPTKQQTINYTIMVIAMSIGLALFFFVADFILNKAVEYLVQAF